MNVEIRAKRILSALPNYQSATDIASTPPAVPKAGGGLLGRYRNTETDVDALWFYETAVIWLSSDAVVEIPFKEIERVELPAEKESEGLILKMRGGRDIPLPVRGKRGRFFDSMEVLRFFDRVLADLHSQT
jgi:hypothetical protein